MTRVITFDEVDRALAKVVARKGEDHVYRWEIGPTPSNVAPAPTCTNWNVVGQPSCIAGHVYEELGLPRTMFAFQDWKMPVPAIVDHLGFAHDIQWEAGAVVLLGFAQKDQDDGQTWGEAAKAGHNTVERWGDELLHVPWGDIPVGFLDNVNKEILEALTG